LLRKIFRLELNDIKQLDELVEAGSCLEKLVDDYNPPFVDDAVACPKVSAFITYYVSASFEQLFNV